MVVNRNKSSPPLDQERIAPLLEHIRANGYACPAPDDAT